MNRIFEKWFQEQQKKDHEKYKEEERLKEAEKEKQDELDELYKDDHLDQYKNPKNED